MEKNPTAVVRLKLAVVMSSIVAACPRCRAPRVCTETARSPGATDQNPQGSNARASGGLLQSPRANAAHLDRHTIAAARRLPDTATEHLDIEDMRRGSNAREAGFKAREMGTS